MVDFKTLSTRPEPVQAPEVLTMAEAARVTREFLQHGPTGVGHTEMGTLTPAWNERGLTWRADFDLDAPVTRRLTGLTTGVEAAGYARPLFTARQKIQALSEVNAHLEVAIAAYEEALRYWPEEARPGIREHYMEPLHRVMDENAKEIAYLENPIRPEEGQAAGVDLQGIHRATGNNAVQQPGEAGQDDVLGVAAPRDVDAGELHGAGDQADAYPDFLRRG